MWAAGYYTSVNQVIPAPTRWLFLSHVLLYALIIMCLENFFFSLFVSSAFSLLLQFMWESSLLFKAGEWYYDYCWLCDKVFMMLLIWQIHKCSINIITSYKFIKWVLAVNNKKMTMLTLKPWNYPLKNVNIMLILVTLAARFVLLTDIFSHACHYYYIYRLYFTKRC